MMPKELQNEWSRSFVKPEDAIHLGNVYRLLNQPGGLDVLVWVGTEADRLTPVWRHFNATRVTVVGLAETPIHVGSLVKCLFFDGTVGWVAFTLLKLNS